MNPPYTVAICEIIAQYKMRQQTPRASPASDGGDQVGRVPDGGVAAQSTLVELHGGREEHADHLARGGLGAQCGPARIRNPGGRHLDRQLAQRGPGLLGLAVGT